MILTFVRHILCKVSYGELCWRQADIVAQNWRLLHTEDIPHGMRRTDHRKILGVNAASRTTDFALDGRR